MCFLGCYAHIHFKLIWVIISVFKTSKLIVSGFEITKEAKNSITTLASYCNAKQRYEPTRTRTKKHVRCVTCAKRGEARVTREASGLGFASDLS